MSISKKIDKLTKIDKAQKAYDEKNVEHMKHVHDHHSAEKHQSEGHFIRSAVYGGLDGIITTFAVVSGVAGAKLAAGIVLILGFANLVADGISMAVGDYLSTRAEQEYYAKERKREEWEVEHYLPGERKEMIDIYVQKGYSKKDATTIIDTLLKNKEAFVDSMMVDELGILEDDENPIKNALVTFGSFTVFGFIPLFAFVGALAFGWFGERTFLVACILTGLTLFGLGALKTKFTGQKWYIAGLQMLAVGGVAAIAAYGVGVLLGGLA
jgi:VIT1/CCC1 family predicted Fe2+/Mn2+ transporter